MDVMTPSRTSFLNDRILTDEELEFVQYVSSDLDYFVKNASSPQNVLVFPPIASHFRFLIHKVIEEDFSRALTSFSIGIDPFRRLIICLQETIRAKVVADMAAGALDSSSSLAVSKNSAADAVASSSYKTLSASLNAKQTLDRALMSIADDNDDDDHRGITDPHHRRYRRRESPSVQTPPTGRSNFHHDRGDIRSDGSSDNLSSPATRSPMTSTPLTAAIAANDSASTPPSARNGVISSSSTAAKDAACRKLRPDAQVYVPRAKRMEEMRQKKATPRHETSFDEGSRSFADSPQHQLNQQQRKSAPKSRPEIPLYVPRFKRQPEMTERKNSPSPSNNNADDWRQQRGDEDNWRDGMIGGNNDRGHEPNNGRTKNERLPKERFRDRGEERRNGRDPAADAVRRNHVDDPSSVDGNHPRLQRSTEEGPQRQKQHSSQNPAIVDNVVNEMTSSLKASLTNDSSSDVKKSTRHKKKLRKSSNKTGLEGGGGESGGGGGGGYEDDDDEADATTELERREERRKRKEDKEKRRAEKDERRKEKERRRRSEAAEADGGGDGGGGQRAEVSNGGEKTIPYQDEFGDAVTDLAAATAAAEAAEAAAEEDPAILHILPSTPLVGLGGEDDSSVLVCGPVVAVSTTPSSQSTPASRPSQPLSSPIVPTSIATSSSPHHRDDRESRPSAEVDVDDDSNESFPALLDPASTSQRVEERQSLPSSTLNHSDDQMDASAHRRPKEESRTFDFEEDDEEFEDVSTSSAATNSAISFSLASASMITDASHLAATAAGSSNCNGVSVAMENNEDVEIDDDSHYRHHDTVDESVGGDTWESMFDNDGEYLDESLMTELITAVGNVSVQKPQFDYNEFVPKEPKLVYETFGHVLEIHDFDPTTTTQDLQQVFASFQRSGFEIKWVDDTHAIGVFASAQAAADALAVENPVFKVRPLSEATHQTKVRAKKFEEMLSQPYKERPQTSAIAARRMVAGALGLRSNIPREQREREREQLKKAKEKRKEKKEVDVKTNAWEADFGEENDKEKD